MNSLESSLFYFRFILFGFIISQQIRADDKIINYIFLSFVLSFLILLTKDLFGHAVTFVSYLMGSQQEVDDSKRDFIKKSLNGKIMIIVMHH